MVNAFQIKLMPRDILHNKQLYHQRKIACFLKDCFDEFFVDLLNSQSWSLCQQRDLSTWMPDLDYFIKLQKQQQFVQTIHDVSTWMPDLDFINKNSSSNTPIMDRVQKIFIWIGKQQSCEATAVLMIADWVTLWICLWWRFQLSGDCLLFSSNFSHQTWTLPDESKEAVISD